MGQDGTKHGVGELKDGGLATLSQEGLGTVVSYKGENDNSNSGDSGTFSFNSNHHMRIGNNYQCSSLQFLLLVRY